MTSHTPGSARWLSSLGHPGYSPAFAARCWAYCQEYYGTRCWTGWSAQSQGSIMFDVIRALYAREGVSL